MVTQYIMTRPIMELCEEAKQRPGAEQQTGAEVLKRWWGQEGINLSVVKLAAALTAMLFI